MSFRWLNSFARPFRAIGSKLGSLIGVGQKASTPIYHGGALHYPAGGRGFFKELGYGLGRIGESIGTGISSAGRNIGEALGLIKETAPFIAREIPVKFNPNLKPWKQVPLFEPIWKGGSVVG